MTKQLIQGLGKGYFYAEQLTFDTDFPADRAHGVSGAQPIALGAGGGAANARGTRSAAGAGRALPGCAAFPDHHGVDESAGDPGCPCLGESQSWSDGDRTYR